MVGLPCDLGFCTSQEVYKLQHHFPYGFYDVYMCKLFASLTLGRLVGLKLVCMGAFYDPKDIFLQD